MPAEQTAHAADGSAVVQLQGDNNSVVVQIGHARLTLTRHDARAQAAQGEAGLLAPYRRAIPLVGRDPLLAGLVEWAENPARRVSVRAIAGRAGSGKTRLAVELIAALDKNSPDTWSSGFVTTRELQRFTANLNLTDCAIARPSLIVVDYAAALVRELRTFFEELSERAALARSDARPLRVLLLEREAELGQGWMKALYGDAPDRADAIAALFDPREPVQMPRIADRSERRRILDDSIRLAARELNRLAPILPAPGADTHFDAKLDEITWGGEPLFLAMAGLLAAREGVANVLALGRVDLAQRLAGQEIERIKRFGCTDAQKKLLAHLAAYATLCGGLSEAERDHAIEAEKAALGFPSAGDRGDLADLLGHALPGAQGGVPPVLPDMIGEAVVLQAFGQWSEAQSLEASRRAVAQAGLRAVQSTIRLAQDFCYAQGAATTPARQAPLRWLDQVLADRSADLAFLINVADVLPEQSAALRPIAASLHGAIAAKLRPLAAANPDAFRPVLAMSLSNLGVNLSDLGRQEEALVAAPEAVGLYRTLAAANPDAFRPDLAQSLNNLAGILSELGRREEALAAAQEAVDLYRTLAAANPNRFRPGLAGSLNNLGNGLTDLGRPEKALAAAREAVGLYRALAAANPEAYRPVLALSLNNLGVKLSELGRREEALAAAQEAVDIRRALAAANPDAFRPGLATSLNNLGTMLSELGRRDEALVAAREAVDIRRALAAANPDAFRLDLAVSLNNLSNSLSALGRRDEALSAAQEAVGLFRALAAANPDAFGPGLARSLGALGGIHKALERPADAAANFREGIATLLPCFVALPAAHASLMADLTRDYLQTADDAEFETAMVDQVGRILMSLTVKEEAKP